jgi:succinate dehydrogenase/fumarate reductase flavoprotein subunit
LFGADQ